MGLNNRKTISINMDIRDLAKLDWICSKMSDDLGFRVSRTNAIVLLCNEYAKGLDIGELERKQYRLSLDYKKPTNEAKRVDYPEPDGQNTAREFSRSEMNKAATTNSGKK